MRSSSHDDDDDLVRGDPDASGRGRNGNLSESPVVSKTAAFLSPCTASRLRSTSQSTTTSVPQQWDAASDGVGWADSVTEAGSTQWMVDVVLESNSIEKPGSFPQALQGILKEDHFVPLEPSLVIREPTEALKAEGPHSLETSDDQKPEGLGVLLLSIDKKPQGPPAVPRRPGSKFRGPHPQCLADRLMQAAVPSCGPRTTTKPGQTFYPSSVLETLLDETTVREELRGLNWMTASDSDDYANRICRPQRTRLPNGSESEKPFRSIFALLVLAKCLESLPDFVHEDVSDLDLPLVAVRDEDGRLQSLQRRNREDKPLEYFDHWKLTDKAHFFDLQWSFTARTFRSSGYGDVQYCQLGSFEVLPFTKPLDKYGRASSEGSILLGAGGSGCVFKCRIHPEFHNFDSYSDINKRGVAIKQLKSTIRESVFRRELKILSKFREEKSHPNVVSLLGAYKQDDLYHLIFPCAEMNLYEYWQKYKEAPALDKDWVTWIAKQIHGIADALHDVHCNHPLRPQSEEQNGFKLVRSNSVEMSAGTELEGLHGDMKAENLLCYEGNSLHDRGLIKIADFGEAEMTASAVGSRERGLAADTPTYRAPEVDLRPSSVRPASDVWSLGCVLLLQVTWMLGGFNYIKTFGERRLKFDIFSPIDSDTFFEFARHDRDGATRVGIRVKPEVTKFFAELHCHQNCTDFLHDLLGVVETKMLVADSTLRKRCTVHRELYDMFQKCNTDSAYAAKSRPWKSHSSAIMLVEFRQDDVEDQPSVRFTHNMESLPIHVGLTTICQRSGEDNPSWRPRVMSF